MKSKNLLSFCFVLTTLIPLFSFAAINPLYKECSQRGYQISGNSCVFPDSTKCLLEDFNTGKCGQKWMTDDYCVPEGQHVWDGERCCEGLVAYLPKGVAGQATCQSKQATFLKKTFLDSYGSIALIALALIGWLLFLKRKKWKA
jgi:hypothetical protein